MLLGLLAFVPIQVFDLSASDGGFSASGDTGQWAWGEPSSVGPEEVCWATGLDGNYLNDTIDYLEVPVPDLTAAVDPVLILTHYYDTRLPDGGVLQVTDANGAWQTLVPVYGYPEVSGFSGSSLGWVNHSFELDSLPAGARLRLAFEADDTMASAGWYVRELAFLDGDGTPPSVMPLDIPSDTQDLTGPYELAFQALDDTNIVSVEARVAFGDGEPILFALGTNGPDAWRTELPGQAADTTVRYTVEVSDGSNVTTWPADGEASFRVFLAAPRDVEGPKGRTVGQSAPLQWLPPDTPHEVQGYRVFDAAGEVVTEVSTLSAVVPLEPDQEPYFTVRGVYEEGVGDASDPVFIEMEVPELLALEPARGATGSQVWVSIRGTSLYMLQSVTSFDFGEGVTVEEIRVESVDVSLVRLQISSAAEEGMRTLRVLGAHGEAVFPDVFEVSSVSLEEVRVSPSVIEQGRVTRLEITAPEVLEGEPTLVAIGDDLTVLGDLSVDGAGVTARLSVASDAATGLRTLYLDDGLRRLPFEVEVVEQVIEQRTSCAHVAGGLSSVPWLPVVLVSLARRRRSDEVP